MRSQPNQQNGTTSALTALVVSRYWRAADAARVLGAWRQSGESGAAFARRHGLSVRRLLRWRDQLQGSVAPRFHPVRVIERAQPIATAGSTPLELELRGGRRIRVHAGFDPELLESLARTVESWGC
jgi:transposase-like protein